MESFCFFKSSSMGLNKCRVLAKPDLVELNIEFCEAFWSKLMKLVEMFRTEVS